MKKLLAIGILAIGSAIGFSINSVAQENQGEVCEPANCEQVAPCPLAPCNQVPCDTVPCNNAPCAAPEVGC